VISVHRLRDRSLRLNRSVWVETRLVRIGEAFDVEHDTGASQNPSVWIDLGLQVSHGNVTLASKRSDVDWALVDRLVVGLQL
jgi:hypothetical protein